MRLKCFEYDSEDRATVNLRQTDAESQRYLGDAVARARARAPLTTYVH